MSKTKRETPKPPVKRTEKFYLVTYRTGLLHQHEARPYQFCVLEDGQDARNVSIVCQHLKKKHALQESTFYSAKIHPAAEQRLVEHEIAKLPLDCALGRLRAEAEEFFAVLSGKPVEARANVLREAETVQKIEAEVEEGEGQVRCLSLRNFMKNLCEGSTDSLLDKACRTLRYAAKHAEIELPAEHPGWSAGKAKKYDAAKLANRWPTYCEKIPELPKLNLPQLDKPIQSDIKKWSNRTK